MKTVMKLPIGIENFQELRTEDFYYVDKTGLISELLHGWGKVNLFTRPGRFGKSLNMNMLKYFFSYGCDPKLFDGLAIAKEPELCDKYMGKFPVISITLKGVDARNYEDAQAAMCSIIGDEALRFHFLLDDPQFSDEEKEPFRQLIRIDQNGRQKSLISPEALKNSFLTLSGLLYRHYGQKVVLLIDEYDVPLDKAQQYGEYFGFSDSEVKAMLEYYGLAEHYDQTKEWYDGYCFGKSDVYCPWDVINFVNQLRFDPEARPRAFWVNSSGNAILRTFLQKATVRTKRELECLVNGKCIAKKINKELTYRELYDTIDNLWSVLVTTGYLTRQEEKEDGSMLLSIPNRQIRRIFEERILNWFQEEVRCDPSWLDAFCSAFKEGSPAAIENQFNSWLKRTISIRDTGARKGHKESFFHCTLLGLLSHREECCRTALARIEEKHYADHLLQDGMKTILKYGIACYKKSCMVRIE